ncbi:LamG-like jellyroll fold domain-containing protein, partial [Microbacterium natoriense]|uniref:LamG-like jellyroll fold domain-containing protein n=1 Tax=Microbacterium natoriense TaxID=284570 RepID=UPI0031DF7ADF
MAVVVGGGAVSASAAPVSPVVGKVSPVGVSLREVQKAQVAQAQAVASAEAVATGEPVVVDALTSPTQLTSALPDGTMQLEVSTVPVRVEQGETWVPVDTSLVPVGEWLEPAASAAPVRFSPGGSDQLAQVQTASGEWVTETWPYGVLPTPTVEGDTATYAEVLPGVDLKMVATTTGQASIYVVKTEKAAQSTKLDDLHVVIDGADLTKTSTGAVEAEAADGSGIVAGQPLWWDSSDGATYREPGEETPSPVTHDVEADRIAMDVGASVAKEEKRTGDDVTYPIYVDPDWASGISGSWYTDAAYPNQSYLNASASDVLRMGRYQQYRGNIFFEFVISALAGKEIRAAQLGATQIKWASCPNSPVQVRTFGPQSGGFTWNQQNHSLWGPVLDTQNPGVCNGPAVAVGWNVTAGVQSKVGQTWLQLGLAPQDENVASRRHFSRAATLYVTYNTRPDTPTNPVFTSPSRQCGTAAAPAMIGQTDVTVQVTQTDPDGGNVDDNIFLMKASDLNTLFQRRTPGLVAQGPRSVTFNGLANGETYAWYARGSDWIHDGNGTTPWCYFTVDTTKPAVPSVSVSGATSFEVGKGIDASMSGASDVAGYVYWVTAGQMTSPAPAVPVSGTVSVAAALPACPSVAAGVRLVCGNGATAVTAKVAPTDGLSTLWVSAYDRAGNQSAATGVPLYASVGTPAASANLDQGHAWQVTAMTTPLPSTVPDSNPWIGAAGIDLIIPSNASTMSTDLPDPPVTSPVLSTNYATAGEEIHSTAPPVDSTKSLTLSMWVKPTHIPTTPHVIAIQNGLDNSVQLQITKTGKYAFCIGAWNVDMYSTGTDSNCAVGGTVTPGTWQMVTG